MAFGGIEVGSSFEAVLRINNTGNTALTVTGMSGPSGYTATGQVDQLRPADLSRSQSGFHLPRNARTTAILTVNADQTNGTNTIAISGTGTRPSGPRTSFGAGRYLVGSDVTSGRYF